MAMRNLKIATLERSTIGFDRLFDLINDNSDDNYPPYNIERIGAGHYRISIALAGFARDEITISADRDILTVEGRKAHKGFHDYLYHGIALRPFKCVFNLADHVEVDRAKYTNGLLDIELVRRGSEGLQLRRIAILIPNRRYEVEDEGTR
jgi:molecular chaperone IbpA